MGVRRMLERIRSAIEDTAIEMSHYITEHPEFGEIGRRMRQEWEIGSAHSLLG